MKKSIITLKLLLVFLSFSKAQNIEFTKENFKDKPDGLKEALKQIKTGDGFYEEGFTKYRFALPYYLKANEFNPNDALLNYKIGNCYLHSNFRTKALPYLEKVLTLKPYVATDVHYLLARAYHLNMDWEKAKKEYALAKKAAVGKDAKEQLDDINKKIEECNTGIKLTEKPVRVFIDNLGNTINSPYADYDPTISADEDILIFTSRRNTTTGGGMDKFIDEYFEDIYISHQVNGKWEMAANIGSPINTKGHDAVKGLSPDGQKLFIYKDDNGDGNIYSCDLEGDKWSKPEKLPKAVNSSAHESSASLSFDGKTLYVVSDREGGIGGRDIYACTQNEKGKWETATNLGAVINTKYDEEGVFMLPDGKTLYFSSEGHNTMGGYDIFKTVYENGKWSKPENIGYPINTPDDDVFFVVSASGKHGYYASVKNDGLGEKDIYQITFLGPEKPLILSTEDDLLANLTMPVSENSLAPALDIKANLVTLLKGIVTDALTGSPLEASIEITDNEKNVSIASFKSNSKTGKYLVSLPSGKNYGIAVKADGYLFHSENFDIAADANYREVTKDIQLKNLSVGNSIVLKNIFFDFDKATLRSSSTNELERLIKLLTDVPTLKIEISGHTDNKGAAEYNLTLSENRAKAVVDYLVSKGISKDRLVAKGYGFSKPLADNDTEEGRQMNRRTEFEILSK